jgi:hypothetical protein
MQSVDNSSYETLSAAEQASLDALAEKLNRGESWKPESKGNRCVGKAPASPWETVVPRDDQKKRCEVLTLITADGPISVWTFNKQLKTKLIKPGISTQAEAEAVPHTERLVRSGDLVAIEYGGELPHPTEEGQTYKRFIVEISRPTEEPASSTSGGAAVDEDIPFSPSVL